MSKLSEKVFELEEAISGFVTNFESVFDNDWEFTKGTIGSEFLIEADGTFINPGVADESNNWVNRRSLLRSYRRLLEVMDKYNIPHSLEDFCEDEIIQDQSYDY